MMLAELPSPTSYSAMGWILVGIVALVTGTNQILKLVDRFTGKNKQQEITPQPLVVTTPDQFVKQKDFGDHVSQNERKFDDLAKERQEDLRIAAQTRRKMHEDIQGVGLQVAALKTTTDLQTKQLDRLDDKLDEQRRELNDKLDKQLPETIATIINAKRV